MRKNSLHDNINRVQLDDSTVETTFLNVAELKESIAEGNPDIVYHIFVMLSGLEGDQRRIVYNLLDLLGDLGGIFASMTLIGYSVHFLITGQEVQE